MENKLSQKRNIAISYLRVLAMFGIFVDHAVSYMDIPMKAIIIQITNSFVLLFLLISGFLYGAKKITNFKEWYLKRFKAILIPSWIFLVFYFSVEALNGSFNIKAILIYFLNLQGLLGTENGPGTLWFLTLLFMCYLLIPLLQKSKDLIKGNKKIYVVMMIIVIIIQLLLAFYCTITLDFGHPLSWYVMAWSIFAFGYYISEFANKNGFEVKHILIATVVMVLFTGTRLYTNTIIDGSLLYDKVISIYTNVALNIWIFVFGYFIITKYQEKFRNKVITYFDRVSYCFYLFHSFVLVHLNPIIENQWIFVIFCLVITIISAQVLKMVSDKVQSKIVFRSKR